MIRLAILGSQAMFVGLALAGLAPPHDAPIEPTLELGLVAVAVMASVTSVVLPLVGRRAAVARVVAWAREGGEGRDDDAVRQRALQAGFTPFILSLALSENPAMLGFILNFLGAPLVHALPLFALGAVLTLARFPTEAGFLAPVEESLGRTLRR